MIDGKFITPNLGGAVLAGITRMSIIELLRHKRYEVTERPVTLSEIKEADANGTLQECFGVGTAVGVASVEEIGNSDFTIKFPKSAPSTIEINQELNKIKMQTMDDPFGWIVPVNLK